MADPSKGPRARVPEVSRNKAAAPPPLMRPAQRTLPPELSDPLKKLIEGQGGSQNADLIEDLLWTALKLVRDNTDRGDLKVLLNTVKELRYAFRVFAPYRHIRKVSIFGSARTLPGEPEYEVARQFANRLAQLGFMVITGAGGGIMEAAQGGAGREKSFGVNIRLPNEQKANSTILDDPKLVNFKYFFTRKVVFVKETHAIALFPGGFGTHDEGFESLTLVQTGKTPPMPIVFLDRPGGSYWREWKGYVKEHLYDRGLIDREDMDLFRVTDDVEEAVREIIGFYRNFHSSRYVRDKFVMRLEVPVGDELLDELNRGFADLLSEGRFESASAFPEEAGLPAEILQLPRLSFTFNRRSLGRLRQLIDRLNREAPMPPDITRTAQSLPREVPPAATGEGNGSSDAAGG